MTGEADDVDAPESQQSQLVDWQSHFGEEGRARQLASLRVLLSAFTGVPGIIGLHGGLPPADAFPFTDMSFTLRDGTKMHISNPTQVLQTPLLIPPKATFRCTALQNLPLQTCHGSRNFPCV